MSLHSVLFNRSVDRENESRTASPALSLPGSRRSPPSSSRNAYWEEDIPSPQREFPPYSHSRTATLENSLPRDHYRAPNPDIDLSGLIPMYPDPGEWRASPRPPYPYHRDEGAPWHPAPDARLPPHHWTPHAGPATHYPNHYVPYCPPSPAPAPAYLLPPSLHAAAPPPPSTSARRARRTTADGAPPKTCAHCHATSTPLWRREPATQRPLCNACGLYLQQRHTLRPQALIDADAPDADADSAPQIPDAEYTGPKCSHCLTRSTSVWRRSKTGAKVCNACGVYARLRGKDRPLSLRRNKIKPRTKHAR